MFLDGLINIVKFANTLIDNLRRTFLVRAINEQSLSKNTDHLLFRSRGPRVSDHQALHMHH